MDAARIVLLASLAAQPGADAREERGGLFCDHPTQVLMVVETVMRLQIPIETVVADLNRDFGRKDGTGKLCNFVQEGQLRFSFIRNTGIAGGEKHPFFVIEVKVYGSIFQNYPGEDPYHAITPPITQYTTRFLVP